MVIIDKFDQLAKANKESVTSVCLKLGIPKSTVSYWRKTDVSPKLEYVEKIADYFGVSVDYLLEKSDIKKPITVSESSEINEYLDELRNREEMKMLFSVSKNCTKEEIEQAVRIIEALRKKD